MDLKLSQNDVITITKITHNVVNSRKEFMFLFYIMNYNHQST